MIDIIVGMNIPIDTVSEITLTSKDIQELATELLAFRLNFSDYDEFGST